MEYIINEDCLDSATITHADATGDLRELVYCEHCKYAPQRDPVDKRYVLCTRIGGSRALDFFCAYGER